MSKYHKFIFENYSFDRISKTLTLVYSLDSSLKFTETYAFGVDEIVEEDSRDLNQAFELLFLLAGVSYFKTYLPEKIEIKNASVDSGLAKFLGQTYQKGLGEFFYVNKLDPKTTIDFPVNSENIQPSKTKNNSGLLVALGGGKDSLVSVELIEYLDVTTWTLGHKKQLEPLVQRVGKPHIWVERSWDKKLLQLNNADAMNGHVPISAIFAAVGNILAVMTGKQDVVVSNEASASEPALTYKGVEINHQYSKSIEFEANWQEVLNNIFSGRKRYYSLLRPYSELQIAKHFAKLFDKYKNVFSSCNRAYTQSSSQICWCGECPKCAFTYLALTPYIEQEQLRQIFGGNNLLLDPKLKPTYEMLMDSGEHKPLECVGTFDECKFAMNQALNIVPELEKIYGLQSTSYKETQTWPALIPDDIKKLVQSLV